ncbi:MAG: hypothetical protein LBN23_00020 [Paludibacter sp.]|nr:hypothetical protein [Paludibacter sp.]
MKTEKFTDSILVAEDIQSFYRSLELLEKANNILQEFDREYKNSVVINDY